MTTPDSRAREAAQYLAALTAERDALAAQLETFRYELDAIPGIKAERDAYAAAADAMAAAHKVERDHWYAFQNTQVSLMTEITARGDALKEAARLALDALEGLFGVPLEHTGVGGGGVAVWRLGGSDQPRKAITALKAAL